MNARLCHGRCSVLEEPNNPNFFRNIIKLQNEISLGMNLMISVPGVSVTLYKLGGILVPVVDPKWSLLVHKGSQMKVKTVVQSNVLSLVIHWT
jgi:hypothetical protein